MEQTIMKVNPWVDGKYSEEEARALGQFAKFAANYKPWFSEWRETDYGKFYDVLAFNLTGGTEYVELKLRAEGTDSYKDCYIEMEKWTSLIRVWRERNIAPLYVNIIGSWKNVYVWFLPEVVKPNIYLGVKVKSDNGQYEIVDRLGLRWDNAYHFQWDDKENKYRITKPTIKNNVTEKAVRNDETSYN